MSILEVIGLTLVGNSHDAIFLFFLARETIAPHTKSCRGFWCIDLFGLELAAETIGAAK